MDMSMAIIIRVINEGHLRIIVWGFYRVNISFIKKCTGNMKICGKKANSFFKIFMSQT